MSNTTNSSQEVLTLRDKGSPFHQLVRMNQRTRLSRKGLERIDLLFLLIESLDLNGDQAIMWTSNNLGLESQFPNRVEIWKRRCHNPLRRSSRRGNLSSIDSQGLIILICSMAERLYPLLHQLLSSKEPNSINKERWSLLYKRFSELLEERMNTRRGAVQRLLSTETIESLIRQLVFTLALSVGFGGFERLRASLLDPT